jgi:hypothetical protein
MAQSKRQCFTASGPDSSHHPRLSFRAIAKLIRVGQRNDREIVARFAEELRKVANQRFRAARGETGDDRADPHRETMVPSLIHILDEVSQGQSPIRSTPHGKCRFIPEGFIARRRKERMKAILAWLGVTVR